MNLQQVKVGDELIFTGRNGAGGDLGLVVARVVVIKAPKHYFYSSADVLILQILEQGPLGDFYVGEVVPSAYAMELTRLSPAAKAKRFVWDLLGIVYEVIAGAIIVSLLLSLGIQLGFIEWFAISSLSVMLVPLLAVIIPPIRIGHPRTYNREYVRKLQVYRFVQYLLTTGAVTLLVVLLFKQ